MSWVIVALLAAVFTSLTTILAKVGLKEVNSNFATAFRTFIVIICALLMSIIVGDLGTIKDLTWENYLFLCLSGVATGLSWIFYFKALQLGTVNQVAPIDKSSFILTSILFLIFFFDDTTKGGNPLNIGMLFLSMLFMGVGTFLMIDKTEENKAENKKWIIYAILSAVFASLVALFIKMGLKDISSNVGTLVRTIIVFIFAVTIVLIKKDYKGVAKVPKKTWLVLTLSGIATGGAWLLEYWAFSMQGVNPVAVNSIGKLSILLTMAFSFFFLKEKFSKKSLLGLFFLVIGIVIIIVFSL